MEDLKQALRRHLSQFARLYQETSALPVCHLAVPAQGKVSIQVDPVVKQKSRKIYLIAPPRAVDAHCLR